MPSAPLPPQQVHAQLHPGAARPGHRQPGGRHVQLLHHHRLILPLRRQQLRGVRAMAGAGLCKFAAGRASAASAATRAPLNDAFIPCLLTGSDLPCPSPHAAPRRPWPTLPPASQFSSPSCGLLLVSERERLRVPNRAMRPANLAFGAAAARLLPAHPLPAPQPPPFSAPALQCSRT